MFLKEKKIVYDLIDKLETKDKAIKLFQDIIRIESVNYGAAYEKGNEKELANFVSDYMRGLGMEVEQIEPYPNRASCVGRLRGTTGKPTLCLYAHLDVVPIGDRKNWKYPPFGGEIHDGKIWGRGGSDMKKAIAAYLIAVEAIRRCDIELTGDVLCAFGAGEETMFPHGIGALVDQGLVKADFALHAHGGIPNEPEGAFTIGLGQRGLVWPEITIKGNPKNGVNPIVKMPKVIEAITNMEFKGWKPHHIVPSGIEIMRGGVSIIRGGHKENAPPDECTITCDIRFSPGVEISDIIDQVKAKLKKLEMEDPELDIEVNIISDALPSWVEPDEPIVKALEDVYREFDPNRDIKRASARHSSDTRVLVLNGIPTATGLAAGGGRDWGHGPNEWVPIEGYLTSIKMIVTLILNLLK